MTKEEAKQIVIRFFKATAGKDSFVLPSEFLEAETTLGGRRSPDMVELYEGVVNGDL